MTSRGDVDMLLRGMDRELKMVQFYRDHPIIAAEDLLRVKLAVPQQAILRDMWFKNFVLVTAGRGTGKCLTGDTLIYTSEGVVPIEKLGSKLEPLSSLEVTVQGINGKEKTSKWYYDGVQETNDLVTSRGFALKITDDHQVVTCNKESELEWVPGSDVKVGDYVVLSRGCNLWSENDHCTLDEATFMGLLVGDGCFRGAKNLLGFTNGDQEVRDIYSRLGDSLFGYFPSLREQPGKCPNLNYTHAKVWDKLSSLGLVNNIYSEQKEVPHSVMRSGKNIVAGFLRGLFEADGGVEKGRCVSYCTKSDRLATQVQLLLLNMGVVSSRRTKLVKYKGEVRPYQVLTITSEGIDIYQRDVGFLSTRKNKDLQDIVGKERNPNIDVIPGLEKLFYSMWDRTRGVLSCEQRNLFKKYKNGYYKPSYSSLKKCVSIYPYNDECKAKLIRIIEDNYYFDPVVSKSRGLNEVYDLVVPGTHSFVGNGFINHNTFLNSVFACLWALLYPGQKVGLLAPSFRQAKMLFAEVEKRWQGAPLLQEATAKRPIVASDRCYLEFRQAGFSSGSMIEAVPLGDGCLKYSELLTLSSGFTTFGDTIPTADLSKDSQVFPSAEKIWSNGEFRLSDEKYYNGIRDTLKITTSKGYSIEGTLNHKIKVLRAGEIVWSRLDKILSGDNVLIDRSYRWHDAPEQVNVEEAYALGLMIGDGCWTVKNGLSYATSDQELIDSLNTAFKGKFKANPDGVHWYFYDNKIKNEWLDFWGLGKSTYAKDKRLPSKILGASREAMAACIAGLYDTDGHYQLGEKDGSVAITVGFTNTSKTLVDQLQFILLHFGIVSYKTYRDRDVKWNRVYELLITGEDVNRFAECIGFKLSRKREGVLAALKEKSRVHSSSDVIPGVLPDMISFRENNRIKKGCGTKGTRHIRPSCLRDRKEASRSDVAYFLAAYSDIKSPMLDKLRELSNPSYYYDSVVGVEKGVAATYDLHVPGTHEYCASGFYSHNSKIRGARYYAILADEFAQIPEDIFNTVILPMGATVADPMENVERLSRQKSLIKSGRATKADFGKRQDNKVIVTSSAFYQFNHMYTAKINYEEAIRQGQDQYAVHTVSFRDMPEGFLSEENLRNSRLKLSRIEFRMEYEAIWEADSAGVFKASLISKCQSNADHSIAIRGRPGAEYILGVDPARASDAFALCLIEVGPVNKVVAAWEYYQNVFPKMAQTIMDICNAYNVIAVHMDAGAGGGGLAMKDLLFEEERWGAASRLVDVGEDDEKHSPGRHILHMFQPSPRANAEAVFAALNLMERDNLTLPKRPQPTGADANSFSELDEAEEIYETVVTMIRQLQLIEVSESRSGVAHFDVPSGGGHASQKKDLYTSFILAAKKAYDLMINDDTGSGILEVGIVTDRVAYPGPHKPKLSDSLEVSQVPMNSWPFKKKFKPGL